MHASASSGLCGHRPKNGGKHKQFKMAVVKSECEVMKTLILFRTLPRVFRGLEILT